MNLISDAWIPVRRADGSTEVIAPWQITVGITSNPIVAVASPRPDFDGALTQFLIGLLQTACLPPDAFTWRKWRREAPSAHELRRHTSHLVYAFELEGERAFMQDAAPSELNKQLDVAELLIEAAGEQTLEQNKDHFVKRGGVRSLCARCAATALFTLQTNAPSGGKGYRTGLRGGGPLTTLVLGKTLWETCWLNVLDRQTYLTNREEHQREADRFPWLAPTRVSDSKSGQVTYPVDVHPDQQFWAMPRRIRLAFEDSTKPAICDLCASETRRIARHFHTRNYGVNYQGFEHPLTPHYLKAGQLIPVHPQPGGIGYRHWLGLVESSTDGATDCRPARVVERFRAQAREDGRLWAFGFDMDNMKARCWYDATMPLLAAPEGLDDVFRALAEQLVLTASWVAGMLRGRIKDAVLGTGDARGDLSYVQGDFWEATESIFYDHVRRLREGLKTPQAEVTVKESWLAELRRAALAIFDRCAQAGNFDAVDPRRVATARNDLSSALAGKEVHKRLGLPMPQRKAA